MIKTILNILLIKCINHVIGHVLNLTMEQLPIETRFEDITLVSSSSAHQYAAP